MKVIPIAIVVLFATVARAIENIEDATHTDGWCHNHMIGEGATACVRHSGCAFDAKTDSCHSKDVHSDAWCSDKGNAGVKECIAYAGCYFDHDFNDDGVADEGEWDQQKWTKTLTAESNRVEPNYEIEGADKMKRKVLFDQRLLDVLGGEEKWNKVTFKKEGNTFKAFLEGEEIEDFMSTFQEYTEWKDVLEKYDENKDGRLAKGEFPDEKEFEVLDLNSDGFVDEKVKYLCLSTGEEAKDEQTCAELAEAGGSHRYDTGTTGVKCETDLECMRSEPTDAKGQPCHSDAGILLTPEECKAGPQCFTFEKKTLNMGTCTASDRMIPKPDFSGSCFSEGEAQGFCDRSGVIRNFAPTCTVDGEFEATQLDHTTGFMFCVDENGHDVPDTRKQVKYLPKRDADGNKVMMSKYEEALKIAEDNGSDEVDKGDLGFPYNCRKKVKQHGNWQCPNAISLTLFGGKLEANDHPDVGNCDTNCNTDKDCKGEQWCCFNGCGNTCQEPILPQADCEHLPEDEELQFTLTKGPAEREKFDLKHGLEVEEEGKKTGHGSEVIVSCARGYSGSKPKKITCHHGIWTNWELRCLQDCPLFKIRRTVDEWSNNDQARADLHDNRLRAGRKPGATTALKHLNSEDGEEVFYDRERNYVIEGDGLQHGDKRVLKCAPGYGVVDGLADVMTDGVETIECVNGAWQATGANVNDPPIPMRTIVCDACFDAPRKGFGGWLDADGRDCRFYGQRASFCIDNQPALDNCRVSCRTCDLAEARYKIWARAITMTKTINRFTLEKVYENAELTDDSTMAKLENAIADQMELKLDAQGISELRYNGELLEYTPLDTIADIIGEVANILDLEGVATRHEEHWHRKKFRNYVAFQPELHRIERKRVWKPNYEKVKPRLKKMRDENGDVLFDESGEPRRVGARQKNNPKPKD